MSNKCLNENCKSKLNIKKLYTAKHSVCNYYSVSYKPYRRVCGICIEKSILHYNRIGKKFKKKVCILGEKLPKQNENFVDLVDSEDSEQSIIELSDSDDCETVNNSAGPSTDSNQITELTRLIKIVLNNTVKPLVDVQHEICQKNLISEKAKYLKTQKELDNLAKKVDNDLDILYKMLYKFDGQQKCIYDKEISIIDRFDPENNIDNDVLMVSLTKLPERPKSLPEEGTIERPPIKLEEKVYGMKYSKMQPWIEGTVKTLITKSRFDILFNSGERKSLNDTNIAYINTSNTQYQVGNRVIAKFQDMDIKLTDKFYVGIIAEPPKFLNNFRYLIFFDDGYAKYVSHEDIRLICGLSANVIDDVHENIKEFISVYLKMYPERHMVKFNKKQLVRIELNNQWYLARVINLDASLVQLQFQNLNYEHTEWIYRGSNRLGPLHDQINNNNEDKGKRSTVLQSVNKMLNRPYIEFEDLTENEEIINTNSNNIQKHSSKVSSTDFTSKAEKCQEISGDTTIIEIPSNYPKPRPYKHQICSPKCMSWVQYDYNKTKYINVLRIPLEYGFTRYVAAVDNNEFGMVIYITPCGCNIISEAQMCDYLEKTAVNDTQMTIDLFNFDCLVNPLSSFIVPKEYIRIPDLSYGMEFKAISVVNSLNASVPPHIEYTTKCKPAPGINLNLDSNFLSGCDCTDNCENKTKCSCWQLTLASLNNYPSIFQDSNIGYRYKRLYNQVLTGIYECNVNCKCKKTCSNRVVQEPHKTSLQLFLTENKGWGVRTLADIPKGCFVCTYVGTVCTENDSEIDAKIHGDEYLADLDFLKIAEEIKDGYEDNVVEQPGQKSDCYNSSDEELNPKWTTKKKMSEFECRMPLRKNQKKNLQNTNTKTDGKHKLSKLNTRQIIKSKPKSLISYLDKDCTYFTLDSRVTGNIGRYFNHSCDPNIFIQNVFVDTHDLKFPWVAYFALTDITAGTELAWNYGYLIGSVKNKTIKCYCGGKSCKGRLL